ncbi:MAG TPA: Type 1 glutamine amidotransferase-like domain-containing protein [Microthrixaceae bacterium]|nr:Type 1 glutamine amidotransferase-like domain-containing protein [Microthrixaceae bacterium]
MRLILCSAGLGALGAWVAEHLGDHRRVAFVDIAAAPLPCRDFVDECRAALVSIGCTVEALDLTRLETARLAERLELSDAVFVSGGYPIYLLEWARRSGFLARVGDAVRDGSLAYIGVSAGAALAGPSMEPLAAPDDPGDVSDYAALGLVDFVVLAHVDRYPSGLVEARLRDWEARVDLRPLADDRALVVTEGRVHEVDSA